MLPYQIFKNQIHKFNCMKHRPSPSDYNEWMIGKEQKNLLPEKQSNKQQWGKDKNIQQKNNEKLRKIYKIKIQNEGYKKIKSQRPSLMNQRKQLRLKTSPDEHMFSSKQFTQMLERRTPKSAVQSTQPVSKGSKKLNIRECHTKSTSFQSNNITVNQYENKKGKSKGDRNKEHGKQNKAGKGSKKQSKYQENSEKFKKNKIKNLFVLKQNKLIKQLIDLSEESSHSSRKCSFEHNPFKSQISIQKQLQSYLNSIDMRVMRKMRQDYSNSLSLKRQSQFSICGVEIDPIDFFTQIRNINMEILQAAAIKIQRFWRKILRKNIFREYKYIFENVMNINGCQKSSRNSDSDSSRILVCIPQSSSDFTSQKESQQQSRNPYQIFLHQQNLRSNKDENQIKEEDEQDQQSIDQQQEVGKDENEEETKGKQNIFKKFKSISPSNQSHLDSSFNTSQLQLYELRNIDFEDLNLQSHGNKLIVPEKQHPMFVQSQSQNSQTILISQTKETILNNSPNQSILKQQQENNVQSYGNCNEFIENRANITKKQPIFIASLNDLDLDYQVQENKQKKGENTNGEGEEDIDQSISYQIHKYQLKTQHTGKINCKKSNWINPFLHPSSQTSQNQQNAEQKTQQVDNIVQFVLQLLIIQFSKQINFMVKKIQRNSRGKRSMYERQIYYSPPYSLIESNEFQQSQNPKQTNNIRIDDKILNLYLQILTEIILSSQKYAEKVFQYLQHPMGPTAYQVLQFFKTNLIQQKIEKYIEQQADSDDDWLLVIPHQVHLEVFQHVRSLLQGNGYENFTMENILMLECWFNSVYQCLNECLDQWRPFGNMHQNYPWTTKPKISRYIYKEYLPYVLQTAQEKLLCYNSYQIGLIFDKSTTPRHLRTLCSFQKQQLKDKRILQYLGQWVFDDDKNWHCWDNQTLYLIISLQKQVENLLIQQLNFQIGHIQQKRNISNIMKTDINNPSMISYK